MRLYFWRSMVWSFLALALAVSSSPASTGPVKTNTGKSAPPANANNGNNGNAVTSLHQAKKLLDTAIHDYDGHRAKAVSEIHHAIHELSPHTQGQKGTKAQGEAKNAANAGQGNGAGKQTTTPGENQAQSDAQLKQALEILGGMGGQIKNTKAAKHIENAIGELNVALKIK